jgi:uncharacterized membrane protein
MKKLVMIGFTEKHRAAEVLTQVRRLTNSWSDDLQDAIAVEVEEDGRLRFLHSHLLDPARNRQDLPSWKALLSAIVPLPHLPASSTAGMASEVRAINAQGSDLLNHPSLDQDFIRNAAAVLRPGHSALLAVVGEWDSAAHALAGYSPVILHTSLLDSAEVTRNQ